MKQINYIIKEVIPIIIGILIALFINNWNEDRKDKKYLNQMFSSIESELEESNIDIKRVIPKQLASIDTLDVYLNNEKVTLYEIIMKSNGIQMPIIKTNTWNAIANSKIELNMKNYLLYLLLKKENKI
jgi:short-subunit dehydrogenase